MIRNSQALPGYTMPDIELDTLGGGRLALDDAGWRVIVVYRGAHCPLCKRYLGELEQMTKDFADADVSLVAISTDEAERARPFIDEIGFSSPVGVGLSFEAMQRLGVFVSEPRNAEEAPAPFAEPALFVVNPDKVLQIVDRSNAPFVRPDMQKVLNGIGFVREKDYPIRGTHGLG